MVIKAWKKDAKRRWSEEAWVEGLKLALGWGQAECRRLDKQETMTPSPEVGGTSLMVLGQRKNVRHKVLGKLVTVTIGLA